MSRVPFFPLASAMITSGMITSGMITAVGMAETPDRNQTVATTDNPVAPQHCLQLLESSLVDFYLPGCVDNEFGGYFENIDQQGEFLTDGEKFLTMQARQLWFFSRLAAANVRADESLAAADSGYQFLRRHFYDEKHGGYITLTTRQGQPANRNKHVYPLSFVIYAFVQYAEASGKPEPLAEAVELFETLERHCYDPKHGGYREFFDQQWNEITDPAEQNWVGQVGTKTYNSHLHLMEAFTALYRAGGDARVGIRLAELVQINMTTVNAPGRKCNLDAWTRDWKLVDSWKNRRPSYGHDVECAWLTLDAANALGRPADTLRKWAIELCECSIVQGYDSEHGGFFYAGNLGEPADDLRKEWWVQSEALVAMLTLEKLTRDDPEASAKYRQRFEETFAFTAKHLVVNRTQHPTGGWWATVNADGSPIDSPSRTSMWQGAYHNGRALLECAELLQD